MEDPRKITAGMDLFLVSGNIERIADLATNIAEEVIERVYAPIGLDIATETPAEIALSILAEVVKVRRGGKAASLSGH